MNVNPKPLSFRLAIALPLLLGAAFAPAALACYLPWQPTSVRYEPPSVPGGMATLILGPDICVLLFDPQDPNPPVVTVAGSDITLTVNLLDLTGIGVPPPLHPVEIPIPALSPGEYRLLTRITASGFPIPDANLPLSVGGGTLVALPIGGSWQIAGIGALVLLAGLFRLGSARLMSSVNRVQSRDS